MEKGGSKQWINLDKPNYFPLLLLHEGRQAVGYQLVLPGRPGLDRILDLDVYMKPSC